jgi:hypothetical protein
MARNFEVRIVLESGIYREISLKWLMSFWAEGFIDVKTQSGQYGKEQRGNQGHLAGRNFAGRQKNRENAACLYRANIRH